MSERIEKRTQGAVDATGFEARHASSYYVDRKGCREFLRRRWLKLTVVCPIDFYLFPGVCITWGPSNDSPQLPEAVRQAAENIAIDRLLADAAYDGEHHHGLCREELGVKRCGLRDCRGRLGFLVMTVLVMSVMATPVRASEASMSLIIRSILKDPLFSHLPWKRSIGTKHSFPRGCGGDGLRKPSNEGRR